MVWAFEAFTNDDAVQQRKIEEIAARFGATLYCRESTETGVVLTFECKPGDEGDEVMAAIIKSGVHAENLGEWGD